MSLIPDSRLLNYNFETYKVSLKKLPIYEIDVDCCLFDTSNAIDPVNFLKAKAFGSFNHLLLDLYHPNSVYFISKDLKIYCCRYVENMKTLDISSVFSSVYSDQVNEPSLCPSLFFPSSDITCFSDGRGTLNIIKTNRAVCSTSGDVTAKWELLNSIKHEADLSVIECRLETIKANPSGDLVHPLMNKLIHCCFLNLSNKPAKSHSKNVTLTWAIYRYIVDSCAFELVKRQIWKGESPPELVTISNDFQCLQIVGDHNFRCVGGTTDYFCNAFDGFNKHQQQSLFANWWKSTCDSVCAEYYLPQCPSDISLDIRYPGGVDGADGNSVLTIVVKLPNGNSVEIYNNTISYSLDHTGTVWKLAEDMLIITFKKTPVDGKAYDSDDGNIECKKSKMAFDRPEDIDNCDDTDLVLATFSFDQPMKTDGHQSSIDEIDISSNEWLFGVRLSPDEPISPCIRSNVDGLIWTRPLATDKWTHRFTLNAFGYVSAAKVDRKLMTCSLPMTDNGNCKCVQFAAIADWQREVYVFMQYRQLDQDMMVKNRTSGRVVDNVADEYFISLDKSSEIMGIVANDRRLFILYSVAKNCSVRVASIDCVL